MQVSIADYEILFNNKSQYIGLKLVISGHSLTLNVGLMDSLLDDSTKYFVGAKFKFKYPNEHTFSDLQIGGVHFSVKVSFERLNLNNRFFFQEREIFSTT